MLPWNQPNAASPSYIPFGGGEVGTRRVGFEVKSVVAGQQAGRIFFEVYEPIVKYQRRTIVDHVAGEVPAIARIAVANEVAARAVLVLQRGSSVNATPGEASNLATDLG